MAAGLSPITLRVDGVKVAAEACVDASGRTLVPLRFIGENLGLAVEWKAPTKEVRVSGKGVEIRLWVGQHRALVNGREQELDTVPVIRAGRTMVPLRFVAEAMGLAVHWDGPSRTVFLARRPGWEEVRPAWVVVVGDVVNVRAGPGTDFPRVAQVRQGTKLATVSSQQGWYEVVLPGGSKGWIAGWLVKETSPPPEPLGKRRVAVVTEDVVNLRAGPGLEYPVVGKVTRYTQLEVLAQEGAWYKVSWGGGSAWIAGWLVAVRVLDTASREESEEGTVVPQEPEDLQSPGAPSVTVLAVNFAAEGQELTVEVRLSGRPSWQLGRLTNPERLYVDLFPAVLAPELVRLEQPLPEGPAVRLRCGQFNSTTARLVLDLRQKGLAWKSVRFDEPSATLFLTVGVPDLAGKVIVLDAGHGSLNPWGSDPGAIGPSGVAERDVVLPVVLKAAELLEQRGASVVLTRTGPSTELGLYDRAELANRRGAHVLVSIHANSSPQPSNRGTATYYYVPSHLEGQREARRTLAFCLQRSLVDRLGLPDKGVRQANFAILRSTNMPSALVELAFISNPTEEQLLADPAFQNAAAEAIVEALLDFFAQRIFS